MGMRTLFLGAVLLVGLSGCGESKKQFDAGFKESFEKSFISSCTSGAVKKGAKESVVKPKCECMAKQLTEKYTPLELAKLSSPDSPETEKIMSSVLNACK